MSEKTEYKKGQHVVCKHNEHKHGGKGNGDLIVGRIESVRSNGDVILINLLTGKRSTKNVEVLRQKNVVVPKREAERVVVAYEERAERSEVRKLAVSIATETRQMKLPIPNPVNVSSVFEFKHPERIKVPTYGHGYVQLVQHWGEDSNVIEAARMSTNAGFRGWGEQHRVGCPSTIQVGKSAFGGKCDCTPTPGDEKLLKYLYDNNHHTPFEMVGLTFEVYAPIFVFREWMRHRVPFSYNEMSSRYTPLPNVDYIPTVERLMLGSDGKNKQAGTIKDAEVLTEQAAREYQSRIKKYYQAGEAIYQDALKSGVPKELARVHLPVGRYSRMRVSSNLRGWFGFLKLRMAPNAQWEIRQDANAIAKIAQEKFPRCMELFLGGEK